MIQIKNSGYFPAIKEVLKIRMLRKKIYNDTWKNDEDWVLLAMMIQKIGRLKTFIIYNNSNTKYENKKDTLIDLINYSLFLLNNLITNKK